MKIWLSKNSEIPIREQIVTQIILGILSGDLPVGSRVPSTREIAKRFQIHPNTVSLAYQKLLGKGLIEFRKGSGFYVLEKDGKAEGEFQIDLLIGEFFRKAQTQGFSRDEVEKHLSKWLAAPRLKMILLVEPDESLCAILTEEIRTATGFEVVGVDVEEFQAKHQTTNAVIAAMVDEKADLEGILPPGKECVFLNARSVSNSMKGEPRPEENDLIAVVSGWNNFLILAKTILIAANIEADSIFLRSTKDTNWEKGLKDASMIICDLLTAKKLGNDKRIRPFRIIADNSLKELIKTAC